MRSFLSWGALADCVKVDGWYYSAHGREVQGAKRANCIKAMRAGARNEGFGRPTYGRWQIGANKRLFNRAFKRFGKSVSFLSMIIFEQTNFGVLT